MGKGRKSPAELFLGDCRRRKLKWQRAVRGPFYNCPICCEPLSVITKKIKEGGHVTIKIRCYRNDCFSHKFVDKPINYEAVDALCEITDMFRVQEVRV